MGKIKDLTNQRFGRLTAIRIVGKDKSNRCLWLCMCDCGNEKVVTSGNLQSGNVRSCGCITKEACAELGKQKIIDLIGQRFGRLVALAREDTLKPGDTRWRCKCDCGNKIVTTTGRLRNGTCKSCGCLHIEKAREQGKKAFKHGGVNSRLYRVWSNMKTRCYNKNNSNFERWGKRGIVVCDEWLHDFSAFQKWSLENGYQEHLSIDRIDNNGIYCPENCRWVTPLEQANNTRKVRFIEFNGEKMSLNAWSRKLGLSASVLYYRLKHLPVAEAFTLPLQNPINSLKQFSSSSE